MKEITKLSLCPICGKKPEVRQVHEDFDVICCGSKQDQHLIGTKWYPTQLGAEEAWNNLVQRAIGKRPKIYQVHFDTSEGSFFEAFSSSAAARQSIRQYIKDQGGKNNWEKLGKGTWACANEKDFVSLVELAVQDE